MSRISSNDLTPALMEVILSTLVELADKLELRTREYESRLSISKM